jgi:asparagine N-glycosylation enzyme membrane subunit Stt3
VTSYVIFFALALIVVGISIYTSRRAGSARDRWNWLDWVARILILTLALASLVWESDVFFYLVIAPAVLLVVLDERRRRSTANRATTPTAGDGNG